MRPKNSYLSAAATLIAICAAASAYAAWLAIAGSADAASARGHRPVAKTLAGNGSFERGVLQWAGYRANVAVVERGVFGRRALAISPRHAATSYALFHRPVLAVRSGRSYQATASLRSVRSNQKLCIQLREFVGRATEGAARSCSARPSLGWQKLAVTYAATRSDSYLALSLYAAGGQGGDRFLADGVEVKASDRELTGLCRKKRNVRTCNRPPTSPPATTTTIAAPSPQTGSTTPKNEPGGTAAPTSTGAQTASAQPSAIRFSTLAPGSALPSSADCATRVRRHAWEPRPQNATFNRTPGHAIQIPAVSYEPEEKVNRLLRRVDGNFTGTTDEILQWASCKWGFEEDTARAVATIESWWNQEAQGDGGESIGLFQVRCMWGRYHKAACPDAQRSSAFNADYALGFRRACFEGLFDYWGNSMQNTRGDVWGCIGLWFSGQWNQGNADYVSRVRSVYQARPWSTDSSFYNSYTTAGAWPPK
jgi:hypothetical protein